MKKKYLLSVVGLFATAVTIMSPMTASAQESAQSDGAVSAAVNDYGRQLQLSFSPHYSLMQKRYAHTETQRLAEENGKDSYTRSDDGLNIQNADVSTKLVSSTKNGNGYQATVDVETSLHMTPSDGTTITIAGQKRDSLDSSGVFRHVLDLQYSGNESSTGLTVVNDQVQLDDDSDQLEPISNPKPASLKSGAKYSVQNAVDVNHSWSTNGVGLDWLAAANYAELWTDSNHSYKGTDMDFMNMGFPIYPDNCTNFVSQALYTGGLKPKNATVLTRTRDDVWSYRAFAQISPTYTWGGAENNYRYMKNYSGAFTSDNNPHHIGPGGVIYADWNGDGTKDHAAFVVGNINTRTTSIPVICQKTHNQHDQPLTILENYASKNYHGATKWYGLQWKA